MEEKKVKQTKQNPIKNLGEYGENGGPGRPKGSKNKFTVIKELIAQTFFDVKGPERLKELAKTRLGFRLLMKDIVKLMPKEFKIEGGSGSGETKVIIVRPEAPQKETSKSTGRDIVLETAEDGRNKVHADSEASSGLGLLNQPGEA